ncbi:hypothetical protein AAVH_22878, partial [Aphelenchoides avenae]
MSASLDKLRQECDDDLINVFIKQCAIVEDTLLKIGVEPSKMPVRPSYDGVTPTARLEASTEHCQGSCNIANKQSTLYMELVEKFSDAIECVAKAPLRSIDNETIGNLSEAESKKALGFAIKAMMFQAKQMLILISRDSAGERLVKLFESQRFRFEEHAAEVDQELQRRTSERDRISALEENIAKRSAEVCEMRAFMKKLSKRLYNAVTGSAKLLKELRTCEKSAIESSVERIISVVQAERDTMKDLQAKLHEANAEKQEMQVATEQLHDDIADVRRQLNEAVAE